MNQRPEAARQLSHCPCPRRGVFLPEPTKNQPSVSWISRSTTLSSPLVGQPITGQNPASSGPAAKLLIDTLKKKVK